MITKYDIRLSMGSTREAAKPAPDHGFSEFVRGAFGPEQVKRRKEFAIDSTEAGVCKRCGGVTDGAIGFPGEHPCSCEEGK